MTAIDLGPRYEPIRELGSGGMGRVLLVRDLHLKKEVALKLLHGPEIAAEDLAQVQKELQLLSQIDHPGIARAHDFGYLDGRPYFTSDFIAGNPLGAVGPLENGAEVLRLARDLADAATFLHRSAILHLDIKPSNVILPAAGDRGRAVLIDFGLFRRGFQGEAGARIKGSLPYMAPECFRGERLGPWTDVYALGVTLFQAATGSLPRIVEESRALEGLAAWDPAPRPPSQLKPSLPADLDRIILKCIALDPRLRFPSAAELFASIGHIEGISPLGGPRVALAAPSVGREGELGALDRFLDGLMGGAESPPAVIITGPRGMGQSHLLREMKVRAQTRGRRFYLETGSDRFLTNFLRRSHPSDGARK